MNEKFDKPAVLNCLSKILELELAGVVRYTHYAFMIYGYNRIPIVSWLQEQADESLVHAREAGEMITYLGELHPWQLVLCWKHISMTLATYCESLWNMSVRRWQFTKNCCLLWMISS